MFPKFVEFARNAEISTDLIIKFISQTEPDTRSRKRVCDILSRLAKFAKLQDVDAIKELTGDYCYINPRQV